MKALIAVLFAVLLGGCSANILVVVEPDEPHGKSVSITHLDAPHAKAERRFVWSSTLPKEQGPDPRFTGEPYDPLKELLR